MNNIGSDIKHTTIIHRGQVSKDILDDLCHIMTTITKRSCKIEEYPIRSLDAFNEIRIIIEAERFYYILRLVDYYIKKYIKMYTRVMHGRVHAKLRAQWQEQKQMQQYEQKKLSEFIDILVKIRKLNITTTLVPDIGSRYNEGYFVLSGYTIKNESDNIVNELIQLASFHSYIKHFMDNEIGSQFIDGMNLSINSDVLTIIAMIYPSMKQIKREYKNIT